MSEPPAPPSPESRHPRGGVVRDTNPDQARVALDDAIASGQFRQVANVAEALFARWEMEYEVARAREFHECQRVRDTNPDVDWFPGGFRDWAMRDDGDHGSTWAIVRGEARSLVIAFEAERVRREKAETALREISGHEHKLGTSSRGSYEAVKAIARAVLAGEGQ